MDRFEIDGGVPLSGEVTISGAKNAALPILAATLMATGPCRLEGIPRLRDIRTILQILETPYGRASAVICHDLDFPVLLRQASQKGIGLIIGPADDWTEITPLHANMATVRAIESGFSLLRPTSDGRSLATDNRGRVIARLDYGDDAMVALLTPTPVTTLYGRVGDLFAWLCVFGMLLMFARAFAPSQRQSSNEISSGAT